MDYYILKIVKDKKTPVKVSFDEWFEHECDLMADGNGGITTTVAATTLGDAYISTIFMGMDHRLGGEGPPILYETMIFGGKHDGYQKRCCTWEEAEVQHRDAVDLVRTVPDRFANLDL